MSDLTPPQTIPVYDPPIDPSIITPTPPPQKVPTYLLFLIPILVLVAVISIYVMLQARAMYQETVAIPSPTRSPVASADSIADWHIYKNEQYNFSFKYPPTSTKVTSPTTGSKLSLVFHQLTSYQYSELWLYVSDEPIFTYPKSDIGESITVDGASATRRDISQGQNPAQTLVEISQGENLITFQLTKDDGDDQINLIFDQILSTFKFISTTQNRDLEQAIKDLVFDNGKSHGISSKDQIIIKINKITGDYAYGTTSFEESVGGSGNIWYATYLGGHWTQIWAGQEPPTCDSLSEWPYPAGFFECTK